MSSPPRYARKRDLAEPDIVEYARAKGIFLVRLHSPIDWLAHFRGAWTPAEIKSPPDVHRKGEVEEFTSAQRVFFAECFKRGAPFQVWRTRDDVDRWIGGVRSMADAFKALEVGGA